MFSIRSAFGFPALVNEKAARTVAAGVASIGLLMLLTGWSVLVLALAVGFALRVASGPRFSPLGLLATRVVAPRLGQARVVPGPPKRFAQCVGLALTVTAAVAGLGFGLDAVQDGLIGALVTFAVLESVLGFCAGCWVFGHLIRYGLIPQQTCATCADISLHRPERARA